MIGFYITNKGRELLTNSTVTTDKVIISKACFGSGGDSISQPDTNITALKNQIAEKTLSPKTDSYVLDTNNPNQICIKVLLNDGVTGTINEVGYKDASGNLIVYGVIQEVEKQEAQEILFENWIKFESADIDKIEIKVQSPEYDLIQEQLTTVESEYLETQTQIADLKSKVEASSGDVNLSNVRQLIPSGTSITNGSDNLNTDKYMKVGNYYCPMASTAQSLGNSPTTHGFMMEVFYPLNAESYVVRMITDSVGDRWIQSANNRSGSYVYTEWDKMLRESAITEYETRISSLETLLDGLQEALAKLA